MRQFGMMMDYVFIAVSIALLIFIGTEVVKRVRSK